MIKAYASVGIRVKIRAYAEARIRAYARSGLGPVLRC